MKKGLLLLTTLFISLTFNAQLAVTNAAPYNSPAYLVNNVLMGQGVTASNITFAGNPNQLGFFSNGLAGAVNPLGMDSGIVISSGNVSAIPTGAPPGPAFTGPGDPIF